MRIKQLTRAGPMQQDSDNRDGTKELQNLQGNFHNTNNTSGGCKYTVFGSHLSKFFRVEQDVPCGSKRQRLDCLGQCWYTDTKPASTETTFIELQTNSPTLR